MQRIQDSMEMSVSRGYLDDAHRGNLPASVRAGKVLTCVALFSIVMFVTLACCIAVLLRVFSA